MSNDQEPAVINSQSDTEVPETQTLPVITDLVLEPQQTEPV